MKLTFVQWLKYIKHYNAAVSFANSFAVLLARRRRSRVRNIKHELNNEYYNNPEPEENLKNAQSNFPTYP